LRGNGEIHGLLIPLLLPPLSLLLLSTLYSRGVTVDEVSPAAGAVLVFPGFLSVSPVWICV
jgi:hypothetical protein